MVRRRLTSFKQPLIFVTALRSSSHSVAQASGKASSNWTTARVICSEASVLSYRFFAPPGRGRLWAGLPSSKFGKWLRGSRRVRAERGDLGQRLPKNEADPLGRPACLTYGLHLRNKPTGCSQCNPMAYVPRTITVPQSGTITGASGIHSRRFSTLSRSDLER